VPFIVRRRCGSGRRRRRSRHPRDPFSRRREGRLWRINLFFPPFVTTMEGLLICPVWATQAPHGLALAWTSTKVPFDFAARTTRTNAVNAALVWLHDHTELPYELISMVGAWVTEPEFQPPAHQRTQRRIRHKNGKTTTQATVFVQCHPARSFCLRKDSTHQFFVTFARTADEMRPAVANHGVYPMRETSAAHQVSTSRCATETVSRARNDPLRHKNRRPLYLTRPGKRATVLHSSKVTPGKKTMTLNRNTVTRMMQVNGRWKRTHGATTTSGMNCKNKTVHIIAVRALLSLSDTAVDCARRRVWRNAQTWLLEEKGWVQRIELGQEGFP
jgi:hypothetical protein